MSRFMKSSFDSHQNLQQRFLPSPVSSNSMQQNGLLIRPCYKRYITFPCQQGEINNTSRLQSYRQKHFKTQAPASEISRFKTTHRIQFYSIHSKNKKIKQEVRFDSYWRERSKLTVLKKLLEDSSPICVKKQEQNQYTINSANSVKKSPQNNLYDSKQMQKAFKDLSVSLKKDRKLKSVFIMNKVNKTRDIGNFIKQTSVPKTIAL